jgi:hypothetical protein
VGFTQEKEPSVEDVNQDEEESEGKKRSAIIGVDSHQERSSVRQ